MIDQVCLNDAFLEVAKEVFETMIFMDIAESSGPDQQIEGDTLLGSITFKGDIEGCLAICCSEVCAKTIAVNMLGMEFDDQISDHYINDAIGEVANMLMGSLKARLQDEFGDTEVSIPSVVGGRELENKLGDGVVRHLTSINIQDEYSAELSLLYKKAD